MFLHRSKMRDSLVSHRSHSHAKSRGWRTMRFESLETRQMFNGSSILSVESFRSNLSACQSGDSSGDVGTSGNELAVDAIIEEEDLVQVFANEQPHADDAAAACDDALEIEESSTPVGCAIPLVITVHETDLKAEPWSYADNVDDAAPLKEGDVVYWDGTADGDFIKVTTADGKSGWISMGATATCPEYTELMDAAGKSSDEVGAEGGVRG